MYLAGCPSMLSSLSSQLLIRGKAPSRTKSMSRHLARLCHWSEKHGLRAQAKGNNDTSPYRPPNISAKIYRPGPGRPEYLLQSVLSFTFRRGQGPTLSVCIDSFFNSLVCRMIRLSCSLKWLAIREYLWPRNEGDYGRRGR